MKVKWIEINGELKLHIFDADTEQFEELKREIVYVIPNQFQGYRVVKDTGQQLILLTVSTVLSDAQEYGRKYASQHNCTYAELLPK